MIKLPLWKITGVVRSAKAGGGVEEDNRTVIVPAESFAEANEIAHDALEHNWAKGTLNSRVVSIAPLAEASRGEQVQIIVHEMVWGRHGTPDV